MFPKIRQMLLALAIAAGILGSASSASAAKGLTGAIYTSDFRGAVVNQNHFALKEAVYLNGGPQNDKGPTLPAGRYYFQVTDASGKTLLSTDFARCRQIDIDASGKITGIPEVVGACGHLLGTDEYPEDPRPHDKPVLLFPFGDSPKGNYKVWLIAQDSAVDGCVDPGSVGQEDFGIDFKNNCAKTDSFKVDPQSGPACAFWEDDFDGPTLDGNRWIVVDTDFPPGNSDENDGSFVSSQVSLVPDPSEPGDGLLRLSLTQNRLQENPERWESIGALVHSVVRCDFGTYEWTMRMGSQTEGPSSPGTNLSGGVSAGFAYADNSQTEVVFEHSAHSAADNANTDWSPESILFVNFHNVEPLEVVSDSEGTQTEQQLLPVGDVYSSFHTYKFIWTPTSIEFYIDDHLVPTPFATHTTNIPVLPGFFMIQYFGRHFAPFGGLATEGTRHFYVDHVSYTPPQ